MSRATSGDMEGSRPAGLPFGLASCLLLVSFGCRTVTEIPVHAGPPRPVFNASAGRGVEASPVSRPVQGDERIEIYLHGRQVPDVVRLQSLAVEPGRLTGVLAEPGPYPVSWSLDEVEKVQVVRGSTGRTILLMTAIVVGVGIVATGAVLGIGAAAAGNG